MPILLRRRKLGRTSCREVANMSETGIRVVRNDHLIDFGDDELIFRWGCTASVPGRRVVNTARAIHGVNDKLGFRRILEENELCPATFFGEDFYNVESDRVGETFTKPYILRRRRHAQGRNFHIVRTADELATVTSRYGEGNYYISELINKVAEYRVFIVSGRVVCVAQKTPGNPEDVAWNVARGGRFDNVRWDNWPLKAVRKSIEAFNLSELDFGGVDVMVGADGECYILEINSAPSLTSEYRQQCFAKAFDYIVRNGKERLPLTQERGGYRKFIHPAVSSRAILA